MVAFGEHIKRNKLAKWQEHYPDYEALKVMLTEMVKTGQHRGQAGTSLSIAGTSLRIKASGPDEAAFEAEIDKQLDKVCKHYVATGTMYSNRVRAIDAFYEEQVAKGELSQEDDQRIRRQLEEVTTEMCHLDAFVNLSYCALMKILKKHDKICETQLRGVYSVKMNQSAIYQVKFPVTILGLSNIYAKLNGRAPDTEAQFDPNQAGGTSFVRKTTKYWVHSRDITSVKCAILRHLPVYKFTLNEVDSDRVTSIYFDNDNLDLYRGRLHKTPGAIALRLRWYGDDPKDGSDVFVERKVHNEAWYGEESRKERFSLPENRIQDFLDGRMSPAQVRALLAENKKNSKEVLDAGYSLAEEVLGHLRHKKLKPMLRTQYMRTAFQKKGDARVRSSLDTELCMAMEPVGPGEWRYQGDLRTDQICHFPHAVLEVKLQLAGEQATPEWVNELVESGMLVEVNKFGKFVHGLAVLEPEKTKEKPYWFHEVDIDPPPAEMKPTDNARAGIELNRDQPTVPTTAPRPVYRQAEPSYLEKLGRLFLRWSVPRQAQKIIHGKLVIEPKVYFANERTFLVWSSLCVQLGSIAIGILAISFHRPNILHVGILLGVLTTIFFLYALTLFHRRAHGLRTRSPDGPYDDRFGPTMVAAILLVALVCNAVISINQSLASSGLPAS